MASILASCIASILSLSLLLLGVQQRSVLAAFVSPRCRQGLLLDGPVNLQSSANRHSALPASASRVAPSAQGAGAAGEDSLRFSSASGYVAAMLAAGIIGSAQLVRGSTQRSRRRIVSSVFASARKVCMVRPSPGLLTPDYLGCWQRRPNATQISAAQQDWTRRDQLLEIEEQVQKLWEEHKVYEEEAPDESIPADKKFFVTFPYPYMNGKLHLGHAFSITKAEFAARFARLDGKRVLFPFAFHCTGMPIAAAALKLKGCIEARQAATPAEAKEEEEDSAAAEAPEEDAAGGVFKGKKSKAVAKSGGLDQYDIMLALGIKDEDIPKFTDPEYWLEHFPPLAVRDMKRLGTAVDWRRSFITTDVSPCYDAFIRWQFLKLREKYLDNGRRPSIFSITTGQPCADHDRADGEGVNPQEYTLIKLKVKEVPSEWRASLGDADVFLVAATLRPETMYGQTNCFVLPEGEYGFFRTTGGEVFVCTQRSAMNMCYQDIGELKELPSGGSEPVCLLTKKGKELVGLPLQAPLASYDTVYALPMLTISMQKGTGIVTSVPAEAPDDYACLMDWKNRANWREQYGVKEEWCQPFDVVEILSFPDADSEAASAPAICQQLKIESHRDKDKLAAAKKEVYQKGFYSGVMKVGPYAGQKVTEVKPRIRQELIDQGLALQYFEPEGKVVARSGDECVVALCDQWYLKYSDKDWTERVRNHVDGKFEMFSDAAQNNLSHAVGWLGDWACSRTFGLGTKLPWDEKWLIESLSDSTVYMAYYTVAHIIGNSLTPGDAGGGIEAKDLTEGVFDYIFCIKDEPPSDTAISRPVLDKMRREFQFWYPVDLRCSGKDLIQNHLTMSLFNHAAVWEDPDLWPQAFFCNGHVMVDSEKMSKSKGNFLTLEEAISSYSADATRITCADSGDGLQDANFSRETCGKTILRLTTLQAWAEDAVAKLPNMRSGSYTFLDRIFDNEISSCVNEAHSSYTRMMFSEALRAVWFDMENLRSQYAILSNGDVHGDIIRRFLDVQTVTLSPIAPHFCEHMWRNVLGKESLVVREQWPTPEKEMDAVLARQYELIQGTLRSFRLQLDKIKNPKKKKKKAAQDTPPPKPTRAVIFVAKGYKDWQTAVLKVLQQEELNEENEPIDKEFMKRVREADSIKDLPKTVMKQVMPFASFVMSKDVKARGREALELELPFDEAGMLRDLSEVIKLQLDLQELEVADAAEEHPGGYEQQRESAGPAKPQIVFLTEELAGAAA
eukprot:TRINITY_DN40132_c0_g1_i1.p1 TRINITY_DN40132_c0_g1~~TRINITY_DN40132_c0_g1_i1.p1  ORF type:complete len:1241 (-),score=317.82 TRINITY_DN40132_c0_g1_i1:51-3773(-)